MDKSALLALMVSTANANGLVTEPITTNEALRCYGIDAYASDFAARQAELSQRPDVQKCLQAQRDANTREMMKTLTNPTPEPSSPSPTLTCTPIGDTGRLSCTFD